MVKRLTILIMISIFMIGCQDSIEDNSEIINV
jgi:hypothetical protein